MKLFGLFALTVSLLTVTTPAHAADRFFDGSLSLEGPVGINPDRPQDHSGMVLGALKLHNLFPHVNLFTAGQIQLNSGLPFTKENKACVGLELETKSGFVPYVYFQRWYDINDNRLVAGIRYGFKSAKF